MDNDGLSNSGVVGRRGQPAKVRAPTTAISAIATSYVALASNPLADIDTTNFLADLYVCGSWEVCKCD